MGKKIFTENGTQADRVIKRFGNARVLAQAIRESTGEKCDPSRVYKWRMPKENGGTDGIIPASAVKDVKAAARHLGVLISDADWAPNTIDDREDLAAVEVAA